MNIHCICHHKIWRNAEFIACVSCVLSSLVCAAIVRATRTVLDVWPFLCLTVGPTVFLFGVHLVYGKWRRERRISAVAGGLALLTWGGFMAGITALAALRNGAALVDEILARADSSLYLDTFSFVVWVSRHRIIGSVLGIAYSSAVPVVFLAVLTLAWTHRETRMWRQCIVFVGSATLCAAFSFFAPAIGAFIHYDVPPDILAGLPAGAGNFHEHDFRMYWSDALNVVDVRHLQGVITFPSFHAVMALMVPEAVRDMRWLVGPALVWSGLVLISTIPIGGHYAIDIFGGVAVWAAFLFLSMKVGERHACRPGFSA